MSRRRLGGLIALAAAFVILAVFAHWFQYFPADLTISLQMQEVNGPVFSVMRAVSQVSTTIPAAIIVTSVAIWLGVSKLRLEAVLLGAATAVISLAVVPALKMLIGRPRPTPELVNVMTQNDGLSFPSGHTVFVMVFYGFIIYLIPKLITKKPLARTLQILLGVLIGLTIASRVYLGAHWASDVTGGFLLGMLALAVIISLYYRLKPRFTAKEA